MFGGVIDDRIVTNELWSLDLGTLEWTLETANNNASDAVPSAVAGHAAHLIGDEMLVFYGHNPYFGYMYVIQKYKISKQFPYFVIFFFFYMFLWKSLCICRAAYRDNCTGTKRWSVVPDNGPHIQGRFGHSLVSYVYEKKEIILIYGGYMLPNEGILTRVSSTLIEYVCDNREWLLLLLLQDHG